MHPRRFGPPALALSAAWWIAAGCRGLPPIPPPASPGSPPPAVQGKLTGDAVWSGTVEIVGDFLIPTGRTLRILAGTRVLVRFADTTKTEPEYLDHATEFLIRGRLQIEGTATQPVVFTSLPYAVATAETATSGWGGMIFDRGEGAVRHCRISGAETGVTILAASPVLADVEVADVRQGFAIHRGSAPVLTRVQVRAAVGGISCWPGSAPALNTVDVEAGEHEGLLVAPGSEPRLTNCRFRGATAGVLWGAATPPPPGIRSDPTLRRAVAASPAAETSPETDLPFQPPEHPPERAPDRIYRGERFIGEDTAWEGEILIDGTVMVAPTAHLIVAPGTVVRFSFRDTDGDGIGESEVFIQGRLTAAGTPSRPILFTAAGAQGPGRWGAINLMGSDVQESSIAWCLIESSFRGLHSHFSRFRAEHAVFRRNCRSLQFQESKAVLRDCAVIGSVNGLRFRDSTVALEGLRVFDNTLGIQILRSSFSLSRTTVTRNALAGVHIRESEGTIADCTITKNTPGLRVSDSRLRIEGNRLQENNAGGLLLRRAEAQVEGNRILDTYGNAVSTDSPGAILRRNRIEGSLRFAIENNSPEAVDAAENWWGSQGPSGELFFDRSDDPRLGPVHTSPALSGPPDLGLPPSRE